MSKKNSCHYCHGHGLDKFWWDHGMANDKGVKHPVHFTLKKPQDEAYACPRCGLPKHLPSPPVDINKKA